MTLESADLVKKYKKIGKSQMWLVTYTNSNNIVKQHTGIKSSTYSTRNSLQHWSDFYLFHLIWVPTGPIRFDLGIHALLNGTTNWSLQ